MKKIYLLIGAVAISTAALAQNELSKVKKGTALEGVKVTKVFNPQAKAAAPAAGDTVGRLFEFLPQFVAGHESLNGSAAGGNVFGKNGDSLNACAQYYKNINNTGIVISKIALMIGDAVQTSTAASSYVRVTLYSGAANKAYHIVNNALESSPTANGPNAALATATLNMSTVMSNSTAAFEVVTLASPVTTAGDICIGLDARFLASGDTIGFVSDQTGDGQGLGYTLTRYAPPGSTNNYVWLVAAEVWNNLDANVAAFAILDVGTAVKEYVNGMKLSDIFPNPATTNATINYTLENDSKNVSLVVFDVTGKRVINENFDSQAAGTHSISVNTSELAAGTYYYQLHANGSFLTKEFVVTK